MRQSKRIYGCLLKLRIAIYLQPDRVMATQTHSWCNLTTAHEQQVSSGKQTTTVFLSFYQDQRAYHPDAAIGSFCSYATISSEKQRLDCYKHHCFAIKHQLHIYPTSPKYFRYSSTEKHLPATLRYYHIPLLF